MDSGGNEHLIYETYPLSTTRKTYSIDGGCEETCLLESALPQSLRIELIDAQLNITTVAYSSSAFSLSMPLAAAQQVIKQSQNSVRIQALNDQIKKQGLKWIAGETSVSSRSYAKKKKLFGFLSDNVLNLQGAEYYKGGIFELRSSGMLPTLPTTPSAAVIPPLINSYDWRNKHGSNKPGSPYYDGDPTGSGWITSVKDQGDSCSSCWAFSATGATEALTNLYFNQHLDLDPYHLDLAEQDAVSCSGAGSCGGTDDPGLILDYYVSTGVVDEACFPYTATDQSCSNKCPISNVRIQINGRIAFPPPGKPLMDDTLKSMIIDYGPLSGGISSLRHVMTLVGYTRDPDDQRTIWIFKNSWGTNYGVNGYWYLKTSISDFVSDCVYDLVSPTNALLTPIISSTPYDILCLDHDGDGYYQWGISSAKPASCPLSSPPEKDCDDSNSGLGPMASDGSCQVLGKSNQFLLLPNQKTTFDLRFSNEDGTFRPAIAVGDYAMLVGGSYAASNYSEMAIADFNDDGQLDFIAATNENPSHLYFYKRTGPYAFQSVFLDYLESDPKAAYWLDPNRGNDPVRASDYGLGLIAADLNNDGKMDFIETVNGDFNKNGSLENYWIAKGNAYINDGTGHFTKTPNAFDFSSIQNGWALGISSTLADVNGDGYPDILVSRQASGGAVNSEVYLLKGNGHGTFSAPIRDEPVFTTNGNPATYITMGDFNNDGMTDAIVGMDDDGDPGAAFIFFGYGNGTFTQVGQKAFDANPDINSGGSDQKGWGNFRAYDVDGDGILDIIAGAGLYPPTAGMPLTAKLLLFRGLSGGRFAPGQQISSEILTPTAFTTPTALPPPKLSALFTAKTGTQNARVWTTTLSNSGVRLAQNAQIDGLTLTQTYGAPCTPVITGPASFPLAVGNIAPQSSANRQVTINFSGCPATARFTTIITFSSNNGAVTGSKTLNNQFR